MSEYRVAGRYAKSLLELAQEKNILDTVLNDMKSFSKVYEENSSLAHALSSPVINSDKKLAVLKQVFEKSFNPLSIQFFDIIVRKNREQYLKAIADGFIEQYNTLKNVAKATVKSATALSEDVLAQITKHIEQQTGKTIQLTAKVDENLIGGLVVQVGDRLFDASIAGKLGKLKNELLNSYISK